MSIPFVYTIKPVSCTYATSVDGPIPEQVMNLFRSLGAEPKHVAHLWEWNIEALWTHQELGLQLRASKWGYTLTLLVADTPHSRSSFFLGGEDRLKAHMEHLLAGMYEPPLGA